MIILFPSVSVHVFWLQMRAPLSLLTIKMANIWQIRGAPYGAQRRVPTHFILYAFTLMLVLLSYRRFVSRLGPTFEKIAFNFRHVTLSTLRSLVGRILENS